MVLRIGSKGLAAAKHYTMAEKARLFGDTDTAKIIIAAGDPGEAPKKLGRELKFLRSSLIRYKLGMV